MKLYESYVAEARARRRRRFAIGIVGAVMLATVAVAALLVFHPANAQRSSQVKADCAAAAAVRLAACDRASLRPTG